MKCREHLKAVLDTDIQEISFEIYCLIRDAALEICQIDPLIYQLSIEVTPEKEIDIHAARWNDQRDEVVVSDSLPRVVELNGLIKSYMTELVDFGPFCHDICATSLEQDRKKFFQEVIR